MIPYRDRLPAVTPLAKRRTWWRALWCLSRAVFTLGWLGHRWRLVRENPSRTAALVHLHPMAGGDFICTACGAMWLDADPDDGSRHLTREMLAAIEGSELPTTTRALTHARRIAAAVDARKGRRSDG